jgi:small-conductance mechanosensitive channel
MEKLADANAPDPNAPVDPTATNTSDLASTVASLQGQVTDLQNQMAQVLQVLTASTNCNEQLQNQVEKLSKEPAKEIIKLSKVAVSNNSINDELSRIKEISKKLNKIK